MKQNDKNLIIAFSAVLTALLIFAIVLFAIIKIVFGDYARFKAFIFEQNDSDKAVAYLADKYGSKFTKLNTVDGYKFINNNEPDIAFDVWYDNDVMSDDYLDTRKKYYVCQYLDNFLENYYINLVYSNDEIMELNVFYSNNFYVSDMLNSDTDVDGYVLNFYLVTEQQIEALKAKEIDDIEAENVFMIAKINGVQQFTDLR